MTRSDDDSDRDRIDGPPHEEVATVSLSPESTNLFPRTFGDLPEIVRGEGAYVYDSDGNEYLDASSGSGCSNLGHGVESVAETAAEQLRRLEYASSMLFVNDASQRFAERLASFLPAGFEHTWMVSGGSEANESAFKLAREYHREIGNREKQIVVGRRLSYHGNTLGSLSATGLSGRREPFEPMLQSWPKAPAAYPYRCRFCADEQTCREHGAECAKELETVIRDVGPEYVAAFVAEPIVGAANAAATPGPEYFPTIRDICDDYDVLLVVDEVLTGMGRTGENFAIEHWDVTPDIVTSAKGLSAAYTPMGVTCPHESLVEVFAEKDDGFTHGHTYSFNPASSAIATAVLEYVADHDVVANAREVGAYARDRLEELYDYDFVGDVRGRGLLLGVEFVEDRETKAPLRNGGPEFRQRLLTEGLRQGICLYPGGGTVDGDRGDHLLLMPPLTCSREDVDVLFERLRNTLDAVDPLA